MVKYSDKKNILYLELRSIPFVFPNFWFCVRWSTSSFASDRRWKSCFGRSDEFGTGYSRHNAAQDLQNDEFSRLQISQYRIQNDAGQRFADTHEKRKISRYCGFYRMDEWTTDNTVVRTIGIRRYRDRWNKKDIFVVTFDKSLGKTRYGRR